MENSANLARSNTENQNNIYTNKKWEISRGFSMKGCKNCYNLKGENNSHPLHMDDPHIHAKDNKQFRITTKQKESVSI